jgi:glycosyltransferase involved in cell wall biosynthesis
MMTALLVNNSATESPLTSAAVRSRIYRGRVLHLINGDDYSGAERVQDLLAQRLRDFGYEVGIVSTKPGRFREARVAQDVPLHELPMRSRFDLRPIFSLAKHLQRERYDLLHTHSVRTALVGRPAAMLARVPMVHHMHCQTSTDVSRRWLSRLNAAIERVSLFRVAGVIAVSATIEQDLCRRGVSSRLVSLIPNGVPSPGPLTDRRPPEDEWVIGVVAMFRPRKGIETLLEALVKLQSLGLPVRLRAVGCFQSAEFEAQTKALVTQLALTDVVEWTGFTQDVNAELRRMDVLVLPSLVPEGLPMSVLEAMAAGVPVVGTRVDGVTDVIQDGVNGLLTEPGNADSLAESLARLVHGETEWSALRQQAYELHALRFSDVNMAEAVADLYGRILSPKKGGQR